MVSCGAVELLFTQEEARGASDGDGGHERGISWRVRAEGHAHATADA